MTTVNEEIETRLNEFAAAVALGRSDFALTIAHGALEFCRDLQVAHGEFAFNLVLCGVCDVALFPLEYLNHVTRLVELAETQASAITSVPVYRHAAAAIDALISPLPAEVREELSTRFASVRAPFDQPYDPSDAAEIEMLLEMGLPTRERDLLLALERIADGDSRVVKGIEGQLDVAAAHSALCHTIRAAPAKYGARHHALGVVHHLAARAAYQLGQEVALYQACEGLLVESRLTSAYTDPLKAAHTILWLVLQTDPSPDACKKVYNTATLGRIRKLTWNTVETLANQRIARLASANLNLVHPLVSAYVDFLARRPVTHRQALLLIERYQGVLAEGAYVLASDDEYRGGVDDFLANELDCLMRYDQNRPRNGDGSRESEPLIARRDVVPTPTADPEDRSYRDVRFELTVVEENDAPAGDSVTLGNVLPASDVVVSLFLSEDWVYVQRSGRKVKPRLLRAMSRNEFDDLAGELIDSLRHPLSSFGLQPSEFAWLYDRLLGRVLAHVPGDVTRLIFIAPQVTLPLHLAFDERTNRYILDDFDVTYAQSATLYRHGLEQTPDQPGPALLISGSRAAGRRPLEYVEDEMVSIARTVGSRFVIEGPVRYVAEVLRHTTRVGLLHYSGHMEPASETTRWSLQLRDGSNGPRDVLARVGPGTELATLLSCYSGDHIDNRPEPWSIATSLLAAGARNVVCCLWEIPDQMAADISLSMYETWISGGSVPFALRRAVLQARKRWSPSFWGAVVCYGPHASSWSQPK